MIISSIKIFFSYERSIKFYFGGYCSFFLPPFLLSINCEGRENHYGVSCSFPYFSYSFSIFCLFSFRFEINCFFLSFQNAICRGTVVSHDFLFLFVELIIREGGKWRDQSDSMIVTTISHAQTFSSNPFFPLLLFSFLLPFCGINYQRDRFFL